MHWCTRVLLAILLGAIALFNHQDRKYHEAERAALQREFHEKEARLFAQEETKRRLRTEILDRLHKNLTEQLNTSLAHSKSLEEERAKVRQQANRLAKRLKDAKKKQQLLEDEQRTNKEKQENEERGRQKSVAEEQTNQNHKSASELERLKTQLALAMPTKKETPSRVEVDVALNIVFELLKRHNDDEKDLSAGEVIAVLGSNIAPVVEQLHSNRTAFPHGENFTIFGGETSLDPEAVRHLEEKHPSKDTFFFASEINPVVATRSVIATDSVDTFIVWDLDNSLNAALTYKSLTFEAKRILREHAATSSRSAIFVIGQKDIPTFLEEQLKLKAVVSAPSALHNNFSVRYFERGGGVAKSSRWQGLDGMTKVEPMEFLTKCHSPAEHMHGLDILLRIVADVLEECGITYWLDSGTLLGAYRFNAYNPMEDDHDLIVDHDEFIEQTHPFRGKIVKRFEEINRQARFIAIDGKPEHYKELIGQLFMSKDGSISGPQIDLIPAKWDEETSKYNIPVAHFHRQTKEGFPKKILFSKKATKWKTKHGYLRSLPILGREYPAPYDVEGYSAVWYSKSDFMNHIVMRQMKENQGHDKYCKESFTAVFAPREPAAVQKMVGRMKEVFPSTFNVSSCPLCQCSPTKCYVPKLSLD